MREQHENDTLSESPNQDLYRRRSSLSPSSAIGSAAMLPTLTQTRFSSPRPLRRSSTEPLPIVLPHSRQAVHWHSVLGKRPPSSQLHFALLLLPSFLYLIFLLSRLDFPGDCHNSAAEHALLFSGRLVGDTTYYYFDATASGSRTLQSRDLLVQAQQVLPILPRRSFRSNYGRLEIPVLTGGGRDFRRFIREDDDAAYHRERLEQLESIDRNTDERDFSYSDPGRFEHYDELDYPKSVTGCYRPKWSYEIHPTCQHFHELGLERPRESTGFDLRYLGRGYFRTTWLLEASYHHSQEEFVLKLLKYNERRDFNQYTYFSIQAEALSMERTTASSRTSNIYGHCGVSIFVERGLPIAHAILPEYEFLDRAVDQPRNRLDPPQKLSLAIHMAEGLAELHGNSRGVVVNDDIQLEQWLLGRDGSVKLNDFNNAKFLQWNPQRQEYCTFRASFDYLFRAPEENTHHSTDESADVYAVGQVFYTLLTGLLPFYDLGEWEAAIEANGHGKLPYFHPQYRKSRGLIEARLVELMELIWQYKPRDRPSIFDVLSHLRETARLYESQNPSATPIANVSHFNLVDH